MIRLPSGRVESAIASRVGAGIWLSVLAFSVVSVLGLLALLIAQTYLPQPWGHKGMTPSLALNTAVSFATNTSWQNYAGESTLGHVGLAAGLGVQAFASAAVGMAVAVALIRGIARRETDRVGNFWVDLVRGIIRILLPLAIVGRDDSQPCSASSRVSARHARSPPSPADRRRCPSDLSHPGNPSS